MNTQVIFTKTIIEPPNTFRATSISEMFIYRIDNVKFIYEVGVAPIGTSQLIIKNITAQHNLLVNLILPIWISSSQSSFLLGKNGEIKVVDLILDEPTVREITKTNSNRHLEENIGIKITPLQVTGPVYVISNPLPI